MFDPSNNALNDTVQVIYTDFPFCADNGNGSVTLLHPTLPVGSTVAQTTSNGNPLLYGDLINMFAAAAASGPYDRS